jgi:hypothetical protein
VIHKVKNTFLAQIGADFEYIVAAFGLDAGKVIKGAGWCPKKKLCRSGPNLPNELITNGMRSMFSVEVCCP